MYLIAGLGNPTMKYYHTRHNAGFEAIDVLSSRVGIKIKKNEQRALTGTGNIGSHKVLLVKPQTYMNDSGAAVGPLVSYYGVDPESEVILISDDVTLPPGQIRIRKKGSAGGHNGLKSIIAHLKTEQFARVRIGVGEVPEGGDMINHVLGHPNREDRKKMKQAYENAADAIELIIDGRIEEAMNRYNGKTS